LCRKQAAKVEEEEEHDNNDAPELSKMDIELAKQNYTYYCSGKKTALELFELPMVLSACGYKVTAVQLNQLQDFLMTRKSGKLDFQALVAVLTQLKKIELADDPTGDGDEYLDAFVALGGLPNKEGLVEKSTLIEIIKEQFELTIDMVVSARLCA
jgi:Ca2+-binding EF-hand superfamily protein